MKKKYLNLEEIDDLPLLNEVKVYYEVLLEEATQTGALEAQDINNEYIRELSRIGKLMYAFERKHVQPKHLKFKSPLVISIENELNKRHLKQRQAAELLDMKESTFSQVMTGRRSISKNLAKKLYTEFHIDPRLILENL